MTRGLALALVLLASVACASEEDPDAFSRPGLIRLADGSEAVDRGEADALRGTVSLRTGEFYFEPTVVTAPAGSTLLVTVENVGQNVHNFEVAGQRIDVTVAEGGRAVASVRVPEAGAVTFSCKFHLPRAMRGEVRAT